MQIQTKIERIKAEIKFLIEGAGTLEEKQAALAEMHTFTDALVIAEASKPQDAE